MTLSNKLITFNRSDSPFQLTSNNYNPFRITILKPEIILISKIPNRSNPGNKSQSIMIKLARMILPLSNLVKVNHKTIQKTETP